MLILYHLCHPPRRFGELRRLLPGISKKMLIQDLSISFTPANTTTLTNIWIMADTSSRPTHQKAD
jgi:HxlR-like helix-turn-helix